MDIISNLRQIVDNSGRRNVVNVIRSEVLDGALRAVQRTSFNEAHNLDVHFIGEQGIDEGGLTREFMHLCMKAMKEADIFTDTVNGKAFIMNCRGKIINYLRFRLLFYVPLIINLLSVSKMSLIG